MLIRVGLELNNEGRAIAWALDFPGCFAYGKEGPEAVITLPTALVAYEDWANQRGGPGWMDLGDFDLRLVETWQCYTIDEHYELAQEGYGVESFFRNDWKPLTEEDAARGLALLRWTREDLLHSAADLSDEQLDRERPGERWSIRGILKHVAGAEWWYLDRLGLAPGQPPIDEKERLVFVRERLNAALPELVGKEVVIGKEGELWSPRKLLRRALWHELDHVQHILKLRFS